MRKIMMAFLLAVLPLYVYAQVIGGGLSVHNHSSNQLGGATLNGTTCVSCIFTAPSLSGGLTADTLHVTSTSALDGAVTLGSGLTGITSAWTKATAGDTITFTNGGATPRTGYLGSDSASVYFNNAGGGTPLAGESLILDSQSHIIRIFGGSTTAEQVRVNAAPSATRYLTLAGSTTNPAIDVSAGSLSIAPSGANIIMGATTLASALDVSANVNNSTTASFTANSSGKEGIVMKANGTAGTVNGIPAGFGGIYSVTQPIVIAPTGTEGLRISPTLTTVAGNLTVTGTGPHAVGGPALSNVGTRFTGTIPASASGANYGVYIDVTAAPTAGDSSYGFIIAPTINKAGSLTHADFASLRLDAPTIGAGAATLTNATTLKITGAPSVGTNQRALWVAAGTSQLDGPVAVGTTFQGGSTTAGDIVLANAKALRSINGLTTDSLRIIYMDSANNTTIPQPLILSSALTYGGVTLSNSVSGTGSMALTASPAFTGVPTAPTASIGTNTTQLATTAYVATFHSQITNALAADVAMNNNTLFFDGPSTAQGTSGTWFASGTVSFLGTAGSQIFCKLWDGTTVIVASSYPAGTTASAALSGIITSPAGNIRISCKDNINTTGNMKFNVTGTSKDSVLTVQRIQ